MRCLKEEKLGAKGEDQKGNKKQRPTFFHDQPLLNLVIEVIKQLLRWCIATMNQESERRLKARQATQCLNLSFKSLLEKLPAPQPTLDPLLETEDHV